MLHGASDKTVRWKATLQMTISRSAASILMTALMAVFLTAGPSRASELRQPSDRPNVILIMADDVGWEAFGCYGGEDYQTPHIDALAASGIQFRHAYSTPICTPTRVKLMTGKYGFRNYTHFGYLNPQERTFGHRLQAAGYRTAIAGKWQLNGLYNSLPGHQDSARPQAAGFDESLLWQVTTGKQVANGGGERFWSPPLEHNGRFVTVEENQGKYGPDLLCEFICDFMHRNREDPFFVYYPMVLVHDPFVATPDTIGDAPPHAGCEQAAAGQSGAQRKLRRDGQLHGQDRGADCCAGCRPRVVREYHHHVHG
jgi:arylsulfatase A